MLLPAASFQNLSALLGFNSPVKSPIRKKKPFFLRLDQSQPKSFYGKRLSLERTNILIMAQFYGFSRLYATWFNALLAVPGLQSCLFNYRYFQEKKLNQILILEKQAKKQRLVHARSNGHLGHYRALRQRLGLPSRGQRTKTNAGTARRLNRRSN